MYFFNEKLKLPRIGLCYIGNFVHPITFHVNKGCV